MVRVSITSRAPIPASRSVAGSAPKCNVNAGGSFNPFDGSDDSTTVAANRLRPGVPAACITFDARTQTEYGTLRSLTSWIGGYQRARQHGGTGRLCPIYATRAFIQFAGFTVGLASSFFDFYATPGIRTRPTSGVRTLGGGGDHGAGLYRAVRQRLCRPRSRSKIRPRVAPRSSASAARRRRRQHANRQQLPDVVGNLRVDQAWGQRADHGCRSSSPCAATMAVPKPPAIRRRSRLCGRRRREVQPAVLARVTTSPSRAPMRKAAIELCRQRCWPASSDQQWRSNAARRLGCMTRVYAGDWVSALTTGWSVVAGYRAPLESALEDLAVRHLW